MIALKVRMRPGVEQNFEFVEGKSDWIDICCPERIEIQKGEYYPINLGFAMEMPPNYEALLIPRSSTFKNYGLLSANSIGLIDNSYCGDEDYWRFPVYATRDTVIEKGARICQFRVQEKMGAVSVTFVDSLGNPNRGGIGSTGL